jgi:hypothetical protein
MNGDQVVNGMRPRDNSDSISKPGRGAAGGGSRIV